MPTTRSERSKEFLARLLEVAAADTSAHPTEWSKENPLLGHCTIVSFLAQEVFGGEVLRVDLRAVPGFEKVAWHSWNHLPDGEEIDFTQSQLAEPLPSDLPRFIVRKEELFIYPTIEARYRLLKGRFFAV